MTENVQQLTKIMDEQNNRSVPEFEGYSPIEMEFVLYDVFSENSPIQLQKLEDVDYKTVPLLNMIKYLAVSISENGEIKLTNTGSLPTKIVADIYGKGFFKDEAIESGVSKLSKETDSMSINLTRILIELTGLAKKRNGKLSITKNGEKILCDDFETLRLIFSTFATKFNWAYYDAFDEKRTGQLGFGFSLILLSKYGNIKRTDDFYSEKYFKAFPMLLKGFSDPYYDTVEKMATHCYSVRTFERFLNYFNLVEIENNMKKRNIHITKTALFDKFIKCVPHRKLDF